MNLLVNLDLNSNQLLNARLQQLGSDITPGAGNAGQIYYHTGTGIARISNGSSLENITNILESISGSGNGLSVGAITGKSQAISLALATTSTAGAMAAADKTKLDGAASANTPSTLVLRDGSGNFTAGTITAALTGTASNASNLNNQAASYYLNFANSTGQRTATSAISDFDTQVRTSRLDQMSAPTAAVAFNSQRITGLADPTSAQDAATKSYVDSMASGLDVKASVRAASTANVAGTYNATGGTSGRGQFTAMPNTLDGVTLAAGNRVLLKNQSTGAQNGIWVVTTLGSGANGVWDRAGDFDSDAEVSAGAFTFVEEGATNADAGFTLTTDNPITIGGASGTALTFAQFSGAGAIAAGDGLNKTGNTLSVVGTTDRISVSGSGVDISTSYVGQTSITTLGTIGTGTWQGTAVALGYGGTGATTAAAARTNLGAAGKFAQTLSTSATSYVVTHNLNSVDVTVTVYEVATGNVVITDVQNTSVNTVTISFATAPNANAYRVVVTG